jgi:hypothetical protein
MEERSMNRVTITLHIDLPEGVTPSVDYGTVPVPTQPRPQGPPPLAAGAWVCPEHGDERIKQWPDGGISCGVKGGSNVNQKGYCRYRATAPKPGPGPAEPPPNFDELPFS